MSPPHYDVVVVGSGPGGSVTALLLARGGARVALVDKAAFPRDKACGDIVGPRGLQELSELGVPLPSGRNVGDIVVVGPNDRRVRLPSGEGLTYPGHGTAVTRMELDRVLHEAAVGEGAVPIRDRMADLLRSDGGLHGVQLASGAELTADFVIGADGATSHVARTAGLVDERRVLWGFAIRTYLPDAVDLPAILFWEPTRWRGFPGYGWVFPGADGGANAGLGLATRSDRTAGARAARAWPEFLAHLHRLGLVAAPSSPGTGRHLGGWLKMGMVGTIPASGRTLLVGDAAGLVNPLQGEGIAQAMGSGRLAARAILNGAGLAAGQYSMTLAAAHLPYHRVAAALQKAMVGRPQAVAVAARLLVTLGRVDAVGGGWSVFWNELLNGAPPNRHRAVARAMTWAGRMSTAHTTTGRWFDGVLSEQRAKGMPTEGAAPGRIPEESVGGLARSLDQI